MATNLVLAQEETTPGRIKSNAAERVQIEFPDRIVGLEAGPIGYADNTTIPPPDLPPHQVDLNLIPNSIRIFGWFLLSTILLSSLVGIFMVSKLRRTPMVKAAQPEFLLIVFCGCIIMGSSIIPMSYQEPLPPQRLDASCMSTLYHFSIGFVACFSALYIRLDRVHKVLKGARQFRRVRVHVPQALPPRLILLIINLLLLITWHLVDPMQWTRQPYPHAVDSFGRSTSTHGTCSSQNQTIETLFWIMLSTVNVFARLLANWESYRGQNLESKFKETTGIGTCMFFFWNLSC